MTQKEQDLQGWVGQLQGDLNERESDWWAKQLGQAAAKEAASKKEPGAADCGSSISDQAGGIDERME